MTSFLYFAQHVPLMKASEGGLSDSPTERIITLRITSERITSERITSERINTERITSERINLNV